VPGKEQMNSIPPRDSASAIERFAHVQKRVCMMWGTRELDVYINHLLTDSRDGQRSGFPVEVTAELLFLAELNKLIRAIDLARKLQINLREAYHKVEQADHGTGGLGDPLAGRDQYAREDREIGAKPRPVVVRKEEEKENFATTLGKGVFALFTSKAILFLIALFLAWQYVLPLFFKK
jgi:hypothetical protein